MGTYSVHFSFYGEEYGNFEETNFNVEAENQFEARRIAWLLSENNDNMQFASNVKLCGITWDASPLNMQDYFNAEAAYEKYRLKYIQNVDIPNHKIQNNVNSLDNCEKEKYQSFGSLQTINIIAKAFGKAHGIIPPSIYDELHYANKFTELLYQEQKYEQADALTGIIDKAEKWDIHAVYDISNLFRNRYITLAGETEIFSNHFVKDGIYPETAITDDFDSTYIRRWNNAVQRKSLSNLPVYGEKDVIRDSQNMDYNYRHIVLNKDILKQEYQVPANLIWYVDPDHIENQSLRDTDTVFAQNAITGEACQWNKDAFLGVLRPDIADNIDFEAIKSEYSQLYGVNEDTRIVHDNNMDEKQNSDDELEAEA